MHDTYLWTHHSHDKMRFYRLTESRVKRIIRYPTRIEEGIIEGAVACMQPNGGKNYSEIWVLYILSGKKNEKKIKIISTLRYPGKSPARDPIPADILREIKSIL